MNEKEEIAYEQGERQVWANLLRECHKNLGHAPTTGTEDAAIRGLLIEREAAIQSLRSLCREFGDNEWDADLHLQDIIEKHLGDHLRAP